MGSSCVRDCERTTHEYAAEDCHNGPITMPGLSLAAAQDIANAKVDPSSSMVPPVPNWFNALKRQDTGPKETPRFDEVLMSPSVQTDGVLPTPRTGRSVAGEFRTPAASPRDSPRPAEEPQSGSEEAYEGTYLGTMKHGTGRLRMDGCTYDGNFLNDHKHGNGVLTWDDGRQYRGQFEDGKFHGGAAMTWPDGRKYLGQYSEDRKHGDGTFAWQDGRRYQGQWVVGKRHGVGVYTNAKGLTRTGMWQMDRPLHWDVPNQDVPVPTPHIGLQMDNLEPPHRPVISKDSDLPTDGTKERSTLQVEANGA